jgi:hypothetical protein
MPNISINISADTVAWYGAIVATLSAIKVLYDIWSDRRRLSIKILPDMHLLETKEREHLKEHYLAVSVTNKGKRPVRIVQVAIQFKWFDTYLLEPHIFRNIPKTLTESDPNLLVTVPKKNFDFDRFSCVIVVEGTGKEHKIFPSSFPLFAKIEYALRAYSARQKIKGARK